MREAVYSDINYLVRAGREFCKSTPFEFDEESYREGVLSLIDDPDCISMVIPEKGHCMAKLVPNLYNAEEIVAKVFTTWGKGGLKCFNEVEKIAKREGAMFLMADSFIDPRIVRFYERDGMKLTDSVYIKEL